jgi:ElaB/YqjD/DUF883 family membrane-anchored ribosome-binding protein
MRGTQANFLDSLRESVRENPLAAALIGGGALWLLMGNDRLKRAASSVSAATAPLADIGARNLRSAEPKFEHSPPTAPDMANGSSQRVSETLRDAASSTSDAVSGAADAIRDRVEESVTYARENLGKLGSALPNKDTLAQAQSSFSDLLERQPLALAAIGLVIGAAVAGAFNASDLENEWVGDHSDSVKADLKARVGAVSQTVREASDTLKAEIGDVGAEALERVQETGRNAMDAARKANTT